MSTEYLDDEERDIIEAYKRGEFKPVKNQKKVKQMLVEAAKNHMKKEARINIRLTNLDLLRLKERAAEEGLPYQTLISSVLHKYVSSSART